jgi:hypothetical protein
MEMNETYMAKLLEMGTMLHPNIGEDNHTNRLLRKLFLREPMQPSELFDLGKYYQRMLGICPDGEHFSAIVWLKGILPQDGPILTHRIPQGWVLEYKDLTGNWYPFQPEFDSPKFEPLGLRVRKI